MYRYRSSLRHDADVSAGDEVAVLVAAVGREAPGDLLVVRRAEHVPDLVRRDRLVTVLGDPPEVAVVLDGHTFWVKSNEREQVTPYLIPVDVCDAARAAPWARDHQNGHIGRVENGLVGATPRPA